MGVKWCRVEMYSKARASVKGHAPKSLKESICGVNGVERRHGFKAPLPMTFVLSESACL